MNPKELLEELSKHKSVYGYGAKMYIDDQEKQEAFLKEMYQEYKEIPSQCILAFGDKFTKGLFDLFEKH